MSLTADSTITLLTAPPGSGKTLRLVWHIREALRASDGPVYVSNVNELSREGDFSGWLDFPDPRKWMELPSGSTLVVDEAQDFFRPDGSRNLSPWYTEMERLRHYGIRLVLATQHHTFLHTHVQKLVTKHEHLVRKNGATSARVYRRSSVMANTSSDRAMAKEDHELWHYPTELYSAYKSAQAHNVKRTIASKYKRAGVLFLVAIALVGLVMWTLRDVDTPPERDPKTAQPATAGARVWGQSDKTEGPKYETATDYAKAHLPRFGTMPWTAPIYDHRGITTDPQIICVSSLAGEDASGQWVEASCRCLTEQGTRYELGQPECRTVARFGPVYNPYRQPSAHAPAATQEVAPTHASAPVSATMRAPQIAGYGDLGVGVSKAP